MKNITTSTAPANIQDEITLWAKDMARMAEVMVNQPVEYLEEGERNFTPAEMKANIFKSCERKCQSAPEVLFKIVLKHFYNDFPDVYRRCFNDPSMPYYFA